MMAKTETAPTEDMGQDIKAQIIEALRDPDVATQAVAAASQTEEGRRLLGLKVGTGPPVGDYRRNYRAEPALRVFGGVEVEHEQGFVPLPPSWIARYKTPDGGTTDQIEDAAFDAQSQPIKTADYKHWLDTLVSGGRIDGEVKSDMATGQFTADGALIDAGENVMGG